jgi:hypothetical protein
MGPGGINAKCNFTLIGFGAVAPSLLVFRDTAFYRFRIEQQCSVVFSVNVSLAGGILENPIREYP